MQHVGDIVQGVLRRFLGQEVEEVSRLLNRDVQLFLYLRKPKQRCINE